MSKLLLRSVLLAVLFSAASSIRSDAAVFNLAADYDQTLSANAGGQWQLGFLDNSQAVGAPFTFLEKSENDGWVTFNTVQGDTWTHSAGGGFPASGALGLPLTDAQIAGAVTLRDWPTAEGTNSQYPHGVVGGHSATIPFFTGWYGVRFTAPATDAYDIQVNAWQPQMYPDMIPPNPLFGGNPRPHQLHVFVDDANPDAAGQTLVARTPITTRSGWINVTGTPEHVASTAPIPGDPSSWDPNNPAQAAEELSRTIGNSTRPTTQRITGVQLNTGDTVIVALAPYFLDQGGSLQAGFNVIDMEVLSGADRIPTSQWDLARDFSVHGSTSTGIGPEAAWSYGALNNGSFVPYDKILFGLDPDDEVAPRENHGLGTTAPGWFFSGATEPETGLVTPVIIKDYDGNNFTTNDDGGGSPPMPTHTGDWSGGKVILHVANDEVSAENTSVLRWTAPRNMNVDVSGDMWRVVLAGLEGDGDRTQAYRLVLNGSSVLASGTIGANTFDCSTGTTSACPESIVIANQAVTAGDTVDLLIAPQSGGTNLTADFDDSTTVDSVDLAIWEAAFGQGNGADADGDGDSDGDDFLAWQREFGMSGGGGEAAIETFVGVDFTITESTGLVTAAPEPTAWGLAIFAGLGGMLRRRCKD